MKYKFLIWEHKIIPNACSLEELLGVEKQYQLKEGFPRAATFPKDAVFPMHPDRPHDTILLDNLYNTDNLIVVSRRLKEFLEARPLVKVEYLPVTILNHKKKPASRDYFIIHPVDLPQCLDIAKSGVTWGIVDKERVDEVKQLVLDESKVDRELFRPKPFFNVIIVERNLAEAIDCEKFTGIRWVELEDYPRPKKRNK